MFINELAEGALRSNYGQNNRIQSFVSKYDFTFRRDLFYLLDYVTSTEIFQIGNCKKKKKKGNETAVGLLIYRKGPPLGVGWVMQGWGGSCRDWVDHTGVGWVIQGWGWSQRSGVGNAGVKWVM